MGDFRFYTARGYLSGEKRLYGAFVCMNSSQFFIGIKIKEARHG